MPCINTIKYPIFKQIEYKTVSKRGTHLMNMAGKKWSKQEDLVLKKYYSKIRSLGHDFFTTRLPGRTWNSIGLRAAVIGVRGEPYTLCTANIEALLEDNLESFYWMGYIMADGHISKNNRLVIGISKKDNDHLLKLAKFIGKDRLRSSIKKSRWLTAQNKLVIPLICKKFGINHNKTYMPPNLIQIMKPFSSKQIISFIIGFIDGDGSVRNQTNRKDYKITVKNHRSWIKNLKYFQKQVFEYIQIPSDCCKINNAGYSEWSISNNKIISGIKKFILDNRLPALDRKWKNVPSYFESAKDKRISMYLKVRQLYEKGMAQRKIAKELNISRSSVVNAIKSFKD